MRKKLLFTIAVVVPFYLLTAGNISYAAAFSVSVLADEVDTPSGVWNPRAADGLLAVQSAAADYSRIYDIQGLGNNRYTDSLQSTARAAVYGSDTSINGGVHPRLLGYAVEPMADAMVSASCSTSTNFIHNCGIIQANPGSDGLAYAYAAVNHRVIALAYPEILRPVLDALATIPVRLDYNLSATGSSSTDASYGVTASFGISGEGIAYGQEVCASPSISSTCKPSAMHLNGTYSDVIRRSTVDQTYLYTISARVMASAGAGARVNSVGGGTATSAAEAQGVADPFLYVDPTWEYAQYFTVQQESLLHPGEWVEATRQWQNTAVPIPPAVWLFGSGLLGLIGVSRRSRKVAH